MVFLCLDIRSAQHVTFNRINFREIKFRDFANFCHNRENKTRENVWDCWLAKLNPREIFDIAYWVEKPVKALNLCPKNCHFQLFSGSFAKLNPHKIFETADSQNLIQKISRIFWLAKFNLAEFNPIKAHQKRCIN